MSSRFIQEREREREKKKKFFINAKNYVYNIKKTLKNIFFKKLFLQNFN